MDRIVRFFASCTPKNLILMIWAFEVAVAIADYYTGYEITFSFFYLGGVALAAWFIGGRFGFVMSIASAVLSLLSDVLAGAAGRELLLAAWNKVLTLSFYVVIVGILSALRSLQLELEEKVRGRTAELTEEMQKRRALEKEILAVSEREQRRIGHDLHDSLCQHLTATAIAGEVLREKLEAKFEPEADDARRLVSLVEEGITMARGLARGLAPVEFDAEGLMAAFSQLARTVTERFHVECRFTCQDPVLIHDSATAVHLFRIAQEAVTNAIKHGQAKHVTIFLAASPDQTRLTIHDDGAGLPDPLPRKRGMGLQIMAHRAHMIEGRLDVRRAKPGTIVECTLRKDEDLLP